MILFAAARPAFFVPESTFCGLDRFRYGFDGDLYGMKDFKTRLRKFIRERRLFAPDDRLLVAVSGGVDSVVALRCLHEEGYPLAVAHINYALRGEESDGDHRFVIALCEELNLPLYARYLDARGFSSQHGVSLQMAARELRYHWFQELVQTEHMPYVVTAHHLTDAIETVLLNLSRGTGIRGLHGILPSNQFLRRPLLFATREEIETYAQERGWAHREDSSNRSEQYQRNIIRHRVLPELRRINPSLDHTFEGNLERFAFVERIFARHVENIFNSAGRKDGRGLRFNIKLLLELPDLRFFLYEWFAPKGFTEGQMYGIIRLLKSESGRYLESPTHILQKDREDLLLLPKVDYHDKAGIVILKLHTPVHFGGIYRFVFERIPLQQVPVDHVPTVAFLDWNQLRMPLRLRYWMHGDVFHPLGLGKKKKLSDFFVDLKIPLHRKHSIPILVNGDGRILWISGYRIDHRFRITDQTREILRVERQNLSIAEPNHNLTQPAYE